MPKPYEKYVLNKGLAVSAIYEPHPFRNIVIKEAVEKPIENYSIEPNINTNSNTIDYVITLNSDSNSTIYYYRIWY